VGPSTGPVPTSSLFFVFITQFILALKKPTYIGAGENVFYAVRAHFDPYLPEGYSHRYVLSYLRFAWTTLLICTGASLRAY